MSNTCGKTTENSMSLTSTSTLTVARKTKQNRNIKLIYEFSYQGEKYIYVDQLHKKEVTFQSKVIVILYVKRRK